MPGAAFESTISKLASTIASIPVDYSSLPQQRLNLENRKRTSLFPWRGQFSPELVDLLLATYTDEHSIVLDPFVGSGTTLFEAARHNLGCYGAEINPAAIYLSRIAELATLNYTDRGLLLAKATLLFEKHLCNHLPATLFRQQSCSSTNLDLASVLKQMLYAASAEPLVYKILAATVILALGDEDFTDGIKLERAYQYVQSVLGGLPTITKTCKVFAADARQIPLDSGKVDLVLTSPPYINVFNYHQNYRKAVELIGWDVLKVARSEIGSNRKHRSNRLLTVVQYSMDMLEALKEMRRTLKPNGTAIIVIGRESKVRSLSFANSYLLTMLATGGAGFRLINRQERCFTNRFGANIYEDLLTLKLDANASIKGGEFGRNAGAWMLSEALKDAPNSTKADLESALREAPMVQPSPLFSADPMERKQ